MSDEQPEKKPKKSSLKQKLLEESRQRRKKSEEKREVLFTFGDNDQYSVVKAECSCGQEFSYIKLNVEEETTGRFKIKYRTFWHTLCRACLDKFEMKKRLKKFFEEGDYRIIESKCKDCEQRFWYIVRKPIGIEGDRYSPNSHYWPRFEKLCQPCSEKFREADYEDDDDDKDDWWKGK